MPPPGQGPPPQIPPVRPGTSHGGPNDSGFGQPPSQAQPPAKKRRGWLWLLLGIPLLGLLAVGGCTALLVTSVRPTIDTTNTFIANVDDGDLRSAYDSLCEPMKARYGYEDWASGVAADLGGEITGYRFTQASVTTGGGEQNATVSGTIDVDGIARDVTFDLVKEGDDWRVCS